jgi:hypothetical protein
MQHRSGAACLCVNTYACTDLWSCVRQLLASMFDKTHTLLQIFCCQMLWLQTFVHAVSVGVVCGSANGQGCRQTTKVLQQEPGEDVAWDSTAIFECGKALPILRWNWIQPSTLQRLLSEAPMLSFC